MIPTIEKTNRDRGFIMKITEWFDPKNIEHIKAYKHLRDKAFWPEDFIPKGMEFPSGWNTVVTGKIADAYIEQMLEKESDK